VCQVDLTVASGGAASWAAGNGPPRGRARGGRGMIELMTSPASSTALVAASASDDTSSTAEVVEDAPSTVEDTTEDASSATDVTVDVTSLATGDVKGADDVEDVEEVALSVVVSSPLSELILDRTTSFRSLSGIAAKPSEIS